jgi:hypothetical protein
LQAPDWQSALNLQGCPSARPPVGAEGLLAAAAEAHVRVPISQLPASQSAFLAHGAPSIMLAGALRVHNPVRGSQIRELQSALTVHDCPSGLPGPVLRVQRPVA